MLDYGLAPDEVVLVECENATPKDNKFFSSRGNLVLTNKSILFATPNFLGKTKNVDRHPLSDVKVYDNTVQAKLDLKFGEDPVLDIFYKTGQNRYILYDKNKAKEFVKQLNKLITGNDIDIDSGLTSSAALIGETIRDTASAFLSAFGVKGKEPEKSVTVCTGCGATITGVKGQIVNCEFCGSTTKLP